MREKFGRESVRIYSFDLETSKAGILTSFFAPICNDDLPGPDLKSINESFAPKTVETIRALNEIIRRKNLEPGGTVKHLYINEALKGHGAIIQEVLDGYMQEHLVKVPDLSNSFASRSVFSTLVSSFPDMLTGDAKDILNEVTTQTDPKYVVDPNYLLNWGVMDNLSRLASIVELNMRGAKKGGVVLNA